MIQRRYAKVNLLMAVITAGVFAVQPNFEKITTYNVNGTGSNIVTAEYSDGLGRGIQTKLKLSNTKDRVACSYYDEVGRPNIATKTFVDTVTPGEYLPGEIGDATLMTELAASNLGDTRAFSESQYWDDPLGRVKTSIGPGSAYMGSTANSWTFGVRLTAIPNYALTEGAVEFLNGFIIRINVTDASKTVIDLLNSLNDAFIASNPFTAGPTHFLTLSRDPEGKISEQLTDIFGKTVNTFSAPDSNGKTGSKISAGYAFDILGNVLTEIPPKKNDTMLIESTQYIYNTLGQVIWKRTPDGGQFKFFYRPDGQIEKSISFSGTEPTITVLREINYIYDNLGRVFNVYQPALGPIPKYCMYYYYDNTSGIKSRSVFSSIPDECIARLTNLTGRLVASIMINSDGKKTNVGELYSYDDEGRINLKFMAMSGSPIYQETDYEYDIHGKIIAEEFYYSGDHIKKKYTYDQLGRLEKVIQSIYDPVAHTSIDKELAKNSYDDLGKLLNKTFSAISPGTYNVANTYDIRDRITNITSSGTQGFNEVIGYTPGSNISHAQYIYNNSSSPIPTHNCAYVYDDLNRLRADTNRVLASITRNVYDYDEVGRFTLKREGLSNLTGYNFYTGNNRLKKTSKNPAAGQEYIYDKNGNLVVDFTKKLVIQYDWRDQPVAFRFYNNLSIAGLTVDALTGTYNGAKDLYVHMSDKVNDGTNTVRLVSAVVMLYNASGNRVCKMEVQE